jgi:phosphate transport system substrate-binding protein
MRNGRTMLVVLAALALAAGACTNASDVAEVGEADDATDPDGGDVDAAGDDQELIDDEEEVGVEAGTADLLGAGATFITPLMLEWVRDNEPGISVNYQSIGSGGGIEQFLSENVDFGSTEAWLTDEEMEEAEEIRGCEALHIPDAFGSVVVAYNDPELEEALNGELLVLDGETIAGIFATEIETWNDPAIQELNPDVDLPDTTLIPVHRSDGSGTTAVFTTYLEDESDMWADEYGSGTEVNWAAGTIGGNGNEGVAAETQQQPGAVGYLSYAYAVENDIPVTAVVNADGNVIEPSLESISAGPEAIIDDVPEDFRFDILGVGDEGFPIVGTHWVLAWECGYDDDVANSLQEFFTWAVTDGDSNAEELFYAPVSGQFEERVLEQIERINSAE